MASNNRPPDPLPRPRGGGATLSSTLPIDRPGNLQVKMDEMKEHITKLKKELETERISSKRLKREKVAELRNVRSEEQKKSAEALASLRLKLEAEKTKELENLRESLMKQMYSERNKLLKEKGASAKSQEGQQREMEAVLQKTKNQYFIEAKEEARKLHEAERTRFLNEMAELRSIKKKLETDLENAEAANRQNGSELRRVAEEHAREMDQLKKDARRDIIHLVEEVKSKQRVTAELEKELGQQAGYALKLQAEKDTLGQELNLAKMADAWERRSQSVSRSTSLDSNRNEDRRLKMTSPSSTSSISALGSREGLSAKQRLDLNNKSKRVDAPLIKAKNPVSRIPTLSSSQNGRRTPTPGHGIGKQDNSVRRRTMSPLLPTSEKKLRMGSSPLNHQGGSIASDTASWHEGDVPSTTPSRTATPVSMASIDLDREDLEVQQLIFSHDMDAAAWLKEKENLEEQLQVLKKRLAEVEESKSKLDWSLRQSQDQNDLLEFRVLELEESKKERDEKELERDQARDRSTTSTHEQLTAINEAKDNTATETSFLPDHPNLVWGIHFDTSVEQLSYKHISELKQKLDQLTCKENSSASEDQKNLLLSISVVLQSAQQTIVKFEETDRDMTQRLAAMEDQYQSLKTQTVEQEEDNQRLHQKNENLRKSLAEMEAEASSYKVLADMKAAEIDKLRTENNQMVNEITDVRASTHTEESYKERIMELEKLLEEQHFQIQSLCKQHSQMESDLEKYQGHIKQLENSERKKESELNRVEGLHPNSYQNECRRSSFMETETEKTDSELQAESLWEAIEATKSSETDTQLNFLQDQSDQETSAVEELFQVLEKGVEKATPNSSVAMDDIPKKEGEEEDGDTVAEDVDTDSSFSLPLPDDEVDDDSSDEEPPRRKLSVPGPFQDASSGFGTESRLESKDDDVPIEDLTEADAAARELSAAGIQGEPMQQGVDGHQDKSTPLPRVDGTKDDRDDLTEEEEESDKEWNESEILQRLGADDKTSSTKLATDGTHSVEYDHVDNDQDEDTQTEISDLMSQNEELKSRVEEKEMTIKEMQETTRTLKQVIRDQMTESEQLRGADESSLERKLEESKMKENTLKRVVKDLQVSEQSLKEQLNQLIEERDDLTSQLKSFEVTFNQGNQDVAHQENLDQRCEAAEEKVKEMEKLNVSMMEKYEMEITKKDVRYQTLEREHERLTSIEQLRDELQQKLSKSEEKLMEKDEVIVALKENLTKYEENEASERFGKEQMNSNFREMEDDLDKLQKDFARKCSEAVQLKAQLKLLEEKMEENANRSSDMITEMKENMEAKEKEAQNALDDITAEKDREINDLQNQLTHAEDNLKAKIEEYENARKLEEQEKEAHYALDEIAEKDREINDLQNQVAHAEDNLKTKIEEYENKRKLEEQEKEAQNALDEIIAEKDREISDLQNHLAHAEDNLKTKIEEYENKRKFEEQEKEAQNALDEIIAEKDREISDLQNHLAHAEDNLKTKIEEYENAIAAVIAEKDKEMSELQMQLAQAEDNLKEKLEESEKKILEAEESKTECNEELSRLRKQLADFQDSQKNVEKAEKEIALKVAEAAALKASLLLMEEEYETEQMEKENIKKAHSKLEEELMTTRESVLKLEEQRSSLKKLLSEMKSEVENLNQENKELDEKLNKYESNSVDIDKNPDPVVCEDVIIAQAEHTTEAVPAESSGDVQQAEKLQCQLTEKEEEVTKLVNLVRALEGEKVAMEERMKGIEELLKDSVIDNEDMLRERIVELEVAEKTLQRRVQELESAQKEAEENVDATLEEMKHLEESYEERFKELRASEQIQLEKAAELEEIGNHWKSEAEMLKEQIDNTESVNKSLKEKLQEVETELEELQVVSKLAGDELGGTQKSLPSLMDEGLGALDTGRTDISHFGEEYEDYEDDVEEDFVLSDDLPQESASEAHSIHSDEKVVLQKRVEELEKSEAELMEKVEILQQSESELEELLGSLQLNEAIVREASEQLEDMRARNLEVEQSLSKALKANQDLQEHVAELEIEKDELVLKLDEDTAKDDQLHQLQKDLERATQAKVNLESKVEELEEAHNHMAKLKDDLEKELEKSQSSNTEMVSKLAENDTPNSSFMTPESLCKLEEENHQIAKQLQEAEEERASFKEKMKALQADIEFLEELKAGGEQSIAELSFQIESLEGEVASKSRMLEENESILEERQTEMEGLRRKLMEKTELNTELEAQNEQLKEEYVVKNKMFQDNANIMEKKVVELDMTKKELASVMSTCDELRATISELEKTVEELSRGKDSDIPKEDLKPSFVEEEMIAREVQPTSMMAPPPPLPTSIPPPTLHSAHIDDGDDEDDENSDRVESTPTIEALQLRIQHLMDNEEKLQEKIDELEQRQSAFHETLAAADSIMAERENDFKEEISELESSNSDLKQMLEEARKQGQVSRRSSEGLTKSEEDISIFDCIDEDDEDDYDCDDDDVEEESRKPEDQEMTTRRRSSARPHKIPPKLKRVASDDTLTQSQEKIADLMVKVDELEKQNADLRCALQQKENPPGTGEIQARSSPDQDFQAQLSQAEQDKNEMQMKIQSLQAKVDAFKPYEGQFKQFLEEKDLSEADRHAQEHVLKPPSDDVKMLREKILELESLLEEIKEELKDTKLSEETLTEISEEQVKEIQRLKDDLEKVRSKASKEKPDVNKSEPDDLKHLKDKLSSVITENKEYETRVQLMNDEIKQMKKTNERLEDEVDILNAHVEELGKSESKLTEDLQASEKSRGKLRLSNEQLERTVKTLEDSIEMLTSRVQESDQGQERVNESNKVLESKFKDMLMSEATLKNNLKQMETTKLDLEEKVKQLKKSDEKWKQEMQEMEEAILDTKRHSRKLEEEVKLLKLDNGQLKHENEILSEKVEDKKSQNEQTQNRLSEMEIGESNLRLQLKNSEIREGKLKEQLKDLEQSVSSLKQKVSRSNQLEGDYDSLQRELQAATQRAEDYERSNVKLEEKLQQLEQNLRSHGMVSLSVSEYQELKAQATLASLADGDPPGAKEGGGAGAAGEVWMRLDQKNKELREVQELYNQSVRENVKLKQSLRDLQTKGGPSSRTQSQNVSGGGGNVEAKTTQTVPLKFLTKGALQTRMLADDEDLTLEDFLNALPPQSSDPSSSIPIKVYGPLIQTDQDLIQVDQSAPSFMHRQPIREQPIGEEVETGHVTTATRPVVDDGFDFDGLGLEVDEIDRLRVGSSVSDDIDVTLSSDAPPLPDTSPPGQLKRSHRRTNSTSSDISDMAPPPLPLPSLPPPPKHMGGGGEGAEQFLSASSQPSLPRAPSFDSGMETQEPEVETSTSQEVHTGPPQLRLPTVPGSGGPPVAPKPGTPLWLKKMVDWQNAEKEKEHGEYGRMKEKVEHLSRANQALEDELRQLKVDREHMKRQVQGVSDARELQQKLQSRDLELEDKERQVIRLKTEIKEREMEVVRLKSQLEALSQAGKTSHSDEMTMWRLKDQLERTQEQLREKEHLIHSHDAALGRVKADLVKKETELLSKENALQLKIDELTMVKERMRLIEEGQRDDTSKLQLSEYSSKLTTLTAQNESLRTRLSELEPLERQVGELRVELSRSSNSTRSTEALERKLQMAQKMLQEKTENEMRLAEDNASLQQRLRTTQTQDTYTKDMEKDYAKLEDQMATLEHERNEAELAVAPLKAKVSYLTKKCQERDDLIRKLKQEIAMVKSDKSSDLLEQIGNLSTLLPDEEYNEPLKTHPRTSKQNGLGPSSRKKNRTNLPDLSDLLNDDEREFLKRESLENGDGLLDAGDDVGEISLQELMKQTKSLRHGIKNSFDDITLDELDLLGTAGETGSDQFSIENGIGLGSRDRKRRSPVSFGFGSSYKSRAAKDRQVHTRIPSSAVPMPSSNQTSPRSLGLDLPDGLTSAPLATQQTRPTTIPFTTQAQYQTNVPLPQPPLPPPALPQGYPPQMLSIPQNQPPAVNGTQGPGQLSAPPGQGLGHHNGLHPSDPPSATYSYTGVSAPNQYSSGGLYPHPSQPVPQMLNNSVPRPQPNTLPNGHPLTNGNQPMPSSMYGVEPTPSIGASLPLSHQNVLNLPGNHPNTNGLYQGPTYNASNQGLGTGSGIPDPPRSLSISREVSKHSVLLTWSLPSMDVMSRSNGVEVVGYRIYVNGQQKQLVSSAHMTKALVDGIYLKTVYRFGICSVSASGLTSSMTELSYNPMSSVPSSTASESARSESIVSTEVSSGPKYGPKEERLFMAVYTYDPESHSPNDNPEYELTFTEGDLITVYGDKRPDGFYHGKIRGRKGLIPSNFIEEISKSESRKRGSRESHSRRSKESSADGRRTREKKGRSDRESRRREGQSHRGSRV